MIEKINIEPKTVILRCTDNAEAVVFTKYCYNHPSESLSTPDYEITVEDSYVGGSYRGFFGRLKRAWAMFKEKPVVYTGVYCEDKEKMKKFLIDCIELIDKED